MYKRILVPVDGSPFSEQILPFAADIARSSGAELDVVRVVDDLPDQPDAKEYTESLATRVGGKGLCIVSRDDVAETIRTEAERVPGTLIALCTHGRSGAMEAILGSVALRMLRSGAPLLVYRPGSSAATGRTEPSKVRTVVVPLDGSPTSETIVPQAAELGRWLGARLIVVSVVESSQRISDLVSAGDVMESGYVHGKAVDIAERYGIEVGWEVLHGDPKEAIPSYVRTQPDAVLAMTTRGRGAIETAIVGSVTAACLRGSGVPVFTRLP